MGKRRGAGREAREYARALLAAVPGTGYRAGLTGRVVSDDRVRARYSNVVRFRFRCACGRRYQLRGVRQDVAYRCGCGQVLRVELQAPWPGLGMGWRFAGVVVGIEGIAVHDPLLRPEARVAIRRLR